MQRNLDDVELLAVIRCTTSRHERRFFKYIRLQILGVMMARGEDYDTDWAREERRKLKRRVGMWTDLMFRVDRQIDNYKKYNFYSTKNLHFWRQFKDLMADVERDAYDEGKTSD